MKNGQVSIFVIVAILLVIGIVLIFFLRDGGIGIVVPSEISPIQSFVEVCVKDTLEQAVFLIGVKGGYYLNKDRVSLDGYSIFYDYGVDYSPTKEIVSNSIESYLNENLVLCTEPFLQFSEFSIFGGVVSSSVVIENSLVSADVTYPLSIKRGDETYTLEKFSSSYSVRLGLVFKQVKGYLGEQVKTPDEICLTCLNDITRAHSLEVELHDAEDDLVVFAFIDNSSKVLEEDFVFVFANRYKAL